MNVCIYAKKKQKKYSVYFYCVLQKKEIKLDNCMDCDSFQIVRNKGIRKVSKKKINVKKEIYEQVIERDNYTCRLHDCTCEGGLELHHIVYRSEDKSLINEPSNCICLCTSHHRLVHSNKHMWQPILKELIKNDS